MIAVTLMHENNKVQHLEYVFHRNNPVLSLKDTNPLPAKSVTRNKMNDVGIQALAKAMLHMNCIADAIL